MTAGARGILRSTRERTMFRMMRTGALVAAAAVTLALGARAEVKIALDSPPDPQRSGTFVFASALAEHLKASGTAVRLIPVNTIGGEAERLDQTSQGLLEVNMADLARAAQLEKQMFGFYAPYLFDSVAHLDKTLANSDLLKRMNDTLTKKGVRVVALVLVGGGMGIFNTKKPITKPEDLAALRIRALDENQMKLFKAWGTNGVVITMPEVANALQTGIADGYINPPFVPFLFGHTSIIKHYTEANVSLPLRVSMVSEDWYKKLSEKDRRTFDEGVAKALAANRAWVTNSDKTALEQLAKAGIKITALSAEGRARFKELSKPAYTAILTQDQIQIFIDAANKNR
jgi:TRAP-type C4-dicarboxylate transport system substrate-binding protein